MQSRRQNRVTTRRENHVARNTLFVHGSDCGKTVHWVVVKSIEHTRRKLDERIEFDQAVVTGGGHESGLTFDVRTDIGRGGSQICWLV